MSYLTFFAPGLGNLMCVLHVQLFSVQANHTVVTRGGGSRNTEASEIFLVLPATWSKAVLLEGFELGALDLSFSVCEVKVILHVLLILRGDSMISHSQKLLF